MRVKTKSKDPKRAEADMKRVQSLVEMKRGYKQQKNLIQAALSNVDLKPKNKITFDSNDENDDSISDENNDLPKENGKDNMQLFSDNESNDETTYNFEVKEQFIGKKGQKLLELQSKYKKDDRFKLDERFLDDDEANNEKDKVNGNNENEDDEHTKQLEILNEVLGKKMPAFAQNAEKEISNSKPKAMLRFDPTQPEHTKYEIKEPPSEKEKKKKKAKLTDESTVNPEPEVSKEQFYKINDSLKNVFEEKQEFSLLNIFNKQLGEHIIKENTDITMAEDVTIKKKPFGTDLTNPFKYDSSTDEDDDDDPDPEEEQSKNINSSVAAESKLKSSRLWTESFFFKRDDYRLQEGLDFVKKMVIEELSEFTQLRRDLKQIVRTKVKNNQRKNKLFKKKLGGRKKNIKIKKALKR